MKDLPDQKNQRKQAKLHEMLYKVYTFARHEQEVPFGPQLDPIEVFTRLFWWVVDTKHFNFPEDPLPKDYIEEELEDPEEQKKFHQLIPAEKFRRHYLPLLNLICEKINCNFFDDPEI